MSTGERPDRPAGLLSVSGEDSLLVTACAGGLVSCVQYSSLIGYVISKLEPVPLIC